MPNSAFVVGPAPPPWMTPPMPPVRSSRHGHCSHSCSRAPHQHPCPLGGDSHASAHGRLGSRILISPLSSSRRGESETGSMRHQRTRRVVSSVVKVQNPPPLMKETDQRCCLWFPHRENLSPTVYPLGGTLTSAATRVN